ncbi:MAG: hypothetical protein ACOZNI_27025 [Myxococcota bacterium]
MFLGRLFRYRARENNTPLENFLSTVLSELLRERAILDELAACLGLRAPPGVPSTRTQVRRSGEETGVADVVVDLPRWRLVLEVKAGASPDREQIRRYGRLFPDAEVALLGPRAELAALHDAEWEGVPRCTWEDFASRVMGKPLDGWSARLAEEFVAVLRQYGYGPLLPISPADVELYSKAARKIQGLRDRKVREAVRGLLPGRQAPEVDDADLWADQPPLEAWWERERSTSDLPLRGLGISADVEADGALTWNLWLRSSKKGPSVSQLRPLGFEQIGDWWWAAVVEGARDAHVEEELADALQIGRSYLRRLGLPAGKQAPAWKRVTPVRDLTEHWLRVRETATRMEVWRRELGRELAARLAASFPDANVWQGRKYVTLKAEGRTAWFWTELVEPARLQLAWGWGNEKRNAERFSALQSAWKDGGGVPTELRLARGTDGGNASTLSADLRAVPAARAVDLLARTAARAFSEVPGLKA